MKPKSNMYAPILFGSVLILAGFSKKLIDLIEKLNVDKFLSCSIIQLLVFLLPLAFYCKLCNIDYVSSLKFKYFSVNKISFCVIMAFLYLFGSIFLRYIGITFFHGAMTDTPGIVYVMTDGENKVLSYFVMAVMPALFEEVVFRGILLSEYQASSSFVAVIMTSAMYGMAHTDFSNLLFYFFTGVIFSVMTVVSDSLIPALAVHLLTNTVNFFMGNSLTDYVRQAGKSALLPFITVTLILLCLFLMFSSLEGIYRDKAFNELMQSRKELLRQAAQSEDESENNKPNNLKLLVDALISPTFAAGAAVFILLSANLF